MRNCKLCLGASFTLKKGLCIECVQSPPKCSQCNELAVKFVNATIFMCENHLGLHKMNQLRKYEWIIKHSVNEIIENKTKSELPMFWYVHDYMIKIKRRDLLQTLSKLWDLSEAYVYDETNSTNPDKIKKMLDKFLIQYKRKYNTT